MALFTKIYVIPHELYQELKGNYENIMLKDEHGSYNRLHEILDDQNYPPDFRNLLVQIKLFLSFPYIQYEPENPYSFEEEFTMRIGQVYSLFDIYSQGNKYILGFISRQIEDLISLVGQEKIQIEFISRAEFDQMFIKESQEVYFRPIYAEDKEEPDVQDIVVPVFHLDTKYQYSQDAKIFGETLEAIEKDMTKVFILHELGILDLLNTNFGWAEIMGIDGKPIPVSEHETKFADFLDLLFSFNNKDTARSYLNNLRSKGEGFYTKEKKAKVGRILLGNYGLKRITPK